jgi:hypothetical protein
MMDEGMRRCPQGPPAYLVLRFSRTPDSGKRQLKRAQDSQRSQVRAMQGGFRAQEFTPGSVLFGRRARIRDRRERVALPACTGETA